VINIKELVTKKIIKSGDIIEVYEYSEGYLKGYNLDGEKVNGRKSGYISENYIEHRKQVLQRAKRDLRRLINANHGQYGKEFTSKFLTLTFGDNITDIDSANYEFEKFIKRLNYHCFGTKKANLKYNVAVEFQDRGAIHYHVIIYNMPYVKANDIANVWGNGFIKINKIDNVDNVGAYVTEYMGKDIDDERLQGKKSYFSSRGLFKPIEITDKKIVETVAAALPFEKLNYSSQFENDYLGTISYKQYNLKK
jgi:hypothetical protein